MKATKATILKLLESPGSNVRLYLFWGPDEGQSRALGAKLLHSLGADRFIVISNVVKGDPAALADEAGAMALFGGRRVIWIEPAGEEIVDGIAALLAAPATESPVVAIAGSSSRPKRLIALAEGSPLAVAFASYLPEGAGAERMVIELGRQFGLEIDRSVASRLGQSCGNDQAIVSRELEKFALFLDSSANRPKALGHDTIDALGADSGDSQVMRLPDLILSGAVETVARSLAEIGASNNAIPIVRALQRRLLILAPARARVERGESVDDVMTSMGKQLFWKEKDSFRAMLQRWTAKDIERLAERSGEAEQRLLFGAGPEIAEVGEELVAVARAARRR